MFSLENHLFLDDLFTGNKNKEKLLISDKFKKQTKILNVIKSFNLLKQSDKNYNKPTNFFSKNFIENKINDEKIFFNNKRIYLYKTELCRSYTELGFCKYGEKCQFSHSPIELRDVTRHPKYKTETCKVFWEYGSCPYGKRCCFLHSNLNLDKDESVEIRHQTFFSKNNKHLLSDGLVDQTVQTVNFDDKLELLKNSQFLKDDERYKIKYKNVNDMMVFCQSISSELMNSVDLSDDSIELNNIQINIPKNQKFFNSTTNLFLDTFFNIHDLSIHLQKRNQYREIDYDYLTNHEKYYK